MSRYFFHLRPAKLAPFVAASVAGFMSIVGFALSAGEPAVNPVDSGREQFTRVRHLRTASVDATHDAVRLFNARSCAECHRLGGLGGAGPNENNVQLLNTLVLRVTSDDFRQADTEEARKNARDRFYPNTRNGIMVLHRQGTSSDYAQWRLTRLKLAAPHHAEISVIEAAKEPDSGRHVISCGCGVGIRIDPLEERNTPPLFGLGTIASIPQTDIDAIALGQPEEIRGRSPRLRSGGFGRFGWKAQTATLEEFNENACAAELGLKTPRFPAAELTHFRKRSPDQRTTPLLTVPAVDMTAADVAALTAFVASLPTPKQFAATSIDQEKDIAAGMRQFTSIGCAVCHVPDLGGAKNIYSDLLLHRVGTIGSGFYGSLPSTDPQVKNSFNVVRGDEFRTPPLWGVADSGPYLHDGSANTLEAAIARHSDQARVASVGFQVNLNATERAQIITFLNSLKAPVEASKQ